jgi:hypothetical protein
MNDLVSKKYSDIGQKILQYFIDRRLVILEGEIGSGKAKVAELVSNFWGKEKDHICVFLKKRQNSPDSSYIPFYVGLAQFLQKNTSLTDVIDPVLTVSSSIPKYGGWGGSFQKLLHYTNELHKTKTPQLNDYEHEILYRYNKNFKNKKLLLIAVDIEEWDNGSIQLLNTILSEELESIYTFTKEVSILVTSSKLSGSAIEKSLLEYLPVKIAVPPLDTNQIVSIFKESGISKEEISYENIIAIQKITGGNAYLIKSLIDYVINNTKLIDVNLFNESNATTEFVSTLLRLRFEQLGATGEQIANILEYASVIGLTFEYKELECISKSEVFELRKIIQKANDLSFIQQPESSPSFSHEIIRMFFLERVNKEKPNHYNTFSECLRLLRPSDYLTRANLYFEAGNFNQATILYIMAIIQWYREGFPIPVVIEHRAMQFAKEYLLK